MANKFNLETVMTVNGAAASAVISIGTAVAAGKTRFLTYLKIERSARMSGGEVTGATAAIVSAAETAAGLTYSEISTFKMPLQLHALSNTSGISGINNPGILAEAKIPNKPNMNHPICAVTGGASSYMVLAINSGPATRIFAQYFDAP